MKKLLFLFAVLLTSVGAWAQETSTLTFEVKGTTGVFGKTGPYSNAWGSSVTEENPYQLVLRTSGDNNINIDNGVDYVMINAGSSGCEYTIEVPAHCSIVSYSFKYSLGDGNNGTNTITVDGTSYEVTKEEKELPVQNVNASSTSFRLTGENKPVKLTNFIVTVTVPSTPIVLDNGYYTFQCAGNNNKKFANYLPGVDRIVPVELGRYNGSVYKITRGEGNKYTIQTYDGKYVTYSGTSGDNIKIKLPKDATDSNKWWVIGYGNNTDNATIVPYHDVIFRKAPGFNYSVSYNGANGALGLYDKTDGNSQWRIASACPPISYKSRIKCQGWYLRYDNTIATLTKRNAENLDENCIYTFIYGGDNKYTIQTSDGKYVTYNTLSANSNAVDISDAATDNNKWWVITPDFTGSNNFSTAGRVDIYPYQANISKSNAAFNLAKWVGADPNGGIGLWYASGSEGGNSYCEIEPVVIEGERYVYIRSSKSTNRYIGVEFVGGDLDCVPEPTTHRLFAFEQSPDYKFCWKLLPIEYDDVQEAYYLYNPYYDWYIGQITGNNVAVGLAKKQEDAGIFQIVQGNEEGTLGRTAFKCLNKKQGDSSIDDYLNLYNQNTIVDWKTHNGSDPDAGSWWYVEDVKTEILENIWMGNLLSEQKELNTDIANIGEGIGKYSCTDQTKLQEHNSEASSAAAAPLSDKIKALVYCLYKHKDIQFDINLPTAGFYRIQSQNGNYGDRRGKYLQNTSVVNAEGNPQGLELSATVGINSIMYIDESKTILSYASGQYLNDYTQQSTVGTEGTAWEIVENNSIKGKYALRRNGATASSQYLSDWNSAERVMDGQNDASAAWTFEIVKALPFTFNSAGLGFATFNAPVAVELPEGVLAYVTQMENNTLQMFRLEDKVVPANTPVMLYCEAAKTESATKELKIVYTYTGNEFLLVVPDEFDYEKSFYGTIAAEPYPTGCTIYSLRKSKGKETVGFYQKADGNLGGFKAWIMITEEPGAPGRAFTIIFDGDDATGLKEALGLENENVEIYDLSGRRLDKPTKGVNVVGGKLVIK